MVEFEMVGLNRGGCISFGASLNLVHWPLKFTCEGMRLPKVEEVQPLDIPKTWKAMEECLRLGLAKAIGVSNFSSKKVFDLLQTASIVPAVNQVCVMMHRQVLMHRARYIYERKCVYEPT
jgi:diketogulonate reductase-like aldo/keto reductase